MKLSRYPSVVLALACSAGALHADIVTLKDGKKLDGNILSESPTSIRMRYHLTPKIWDEKDIPRSEIAEGGILKQKPEEVEMIEIRKYVPTGDLLTAEKYEQLIQDRLRPFLNRYPGTKEAAEVEKMIAEVQVEKEKVVAGGIKMKGVWLSREEAKAESLNIKAYAIYIALMERVAAKDYLGALKEFDNLVPPNTGYPASIFYPKAVEEIRTILASYERQVSQMMQDQPTLQRMRDDSLKKLIEPDLSRTNDAIKRERAAWVANYTEEKKVTRWFTPYKYDLENLKVLLKSLTEEKDRLKAIDLAIITKVNDIIARLLRADAKAGRDKAELTKMGAAIVEGEAAAGNADAKSKEFYRAVFGNYRQRHAYFSQMVNSATGQTAPAAAGAAGGSSAIAGSTAPETDDKVAAALAAASAPAPAPVAAAPAPGAMPPAGQPGAAAPGAYPQGQQPGYAQQPNGYPAGQPGAYQQPGYAQPQAAAPAPEEGMGTMTMILIGIGVVGVVLLGAVFISKKKKKE